MKIKSILTKSITAAAFTLVGAVAMNNVNNNDVQAAVVQNDAAVYTTHTSATVYNNYENGQATGQVLAANTSWKVIKTAYDAQGNKWYDLGKHQWVMAEKHETVKVSAPKAQVNTVNNTNTQTVSNNASVTTNTSNVSYTSNASGSEASAKAWIAGRESGVHTVQEMVNTLVSTNYQHHTLMVITQLLTKKELLTTM